MFWGRSCKQQPGDLRRSISLSMSQFVHLRNERNWAYTLYGTLHLRRSYILKGSFWANTTNPIDCQSVTFTLSSSKWRLVATPRSRWSRFPMKEAECASYSIRTQVISKITLKELRRKVQINFTDDYSRWMCVCARVCFHAFLSLCTYILNCFISS